MIAHFGLLSMHKVISQMQVAMRTLAGSELAIGFYPKFIYNSAGGGGMARASSSRTPGRTNLEFDPQSVSIPDVTGMTSKRSVKLTPLYGVLKDAIAGAGALKESNAVFISLHSLRTAICMQQHF